jgi:putative ABC transport system permease protein
MLTPSRIIRRLRTLFSMGTRDAELNEELQFHISMEEEKLVAAGMSRADAHTQALRQFGGVARHRDDTRDARGTRPIEDLLNDLRIGLRGLAKQRTYAVVAIATLAIGIGATTGLWAAVYRVLLQPFPFPDADRIVTVWENDSRAPSRTLPVSSGNFLDWKARNRSFDMLAAVEPWSFDFIGREGPERFDVMLVTADFFPIQGLRPVLGRTFTPDEFAEGKNYVVLLSETTWRVRFGGDSSVVNRSYVLDSIPRTIIGVMPEDAMRPFDGEMWAPKVPRPTDATSRSGGFWNVIARLAPGVSMEKADADMKRVSAELATEFPATNKSVGVSIVELRDTIAGDARSSMLVLLGAVAFVLLIACVNVANLQLAECVRRQRELAVRTAIGAGRGRLVRQMLTESMLIAAIGTGIALGIAYWCIAAIRVFAPENLWLLQRLEMGPPAYFFAAGLAIIATLAVAMPPVIAIRKIQLGEALAAGRRTGSGRTRRRANRFLVVSEVALAFVLMVGAGLLLRSLSVLLRADAGFTHENVLVANVQAWSYYPTPEQRAEFVRNTTERLRVMPGVQSAGMSSALPLTWPIGLERVRVTVEGKPVAPGEAVPPVRATSATAGYFDALRIPIVKGRPFGPTDLATSTPVVLVNATFARRFFGDEEPIGKRVSFGFMGPPIAREIIGVVGDVRHGGLHEEPTAGVFLPHAQGATGANHFLIRVNGDPATFERAVRAEMAAINGQMPLSSVTTMEALLGETLKQRRFQLGLLTSFSGIALLLAAIGIYGIMSRATSERTHEIGVRLAIGADAGQVRWMVLRSGSSLAAFGIGIGLGLALMLTRYMSGMLFGVTPLDAPTYIGAAGLLLTAAVLATWLPAWRASRVDPVIALRDE